MAPRCYGNSSIGSCLQCLTTKILRPETQVWQLAWRRSLTAWFYVPTGVVLVLLACWGVDSLIGLSSVSFPASVALLIVLFFALFICGTILGDRRTKKIVHVIEIPVSFYCLYARYSNLRDFRRGLRYDISMSSLRLHSVSASWYSVCSNWKTSKANKFWLTLSLI